MILEKLRRWSKEHPGERAVSYYKTSSSDPESLTWRELWETVAELGTALSREFEPGALLLLAFPQGLEFYACQLASHYAGCVPIPTSLPTDASGAERLRGVIADSQSAGLLCLEKHLSDFGKLGDTIDIVSFEELDARRVVEPAPPFATSKKDLAFIQYTSGSVSAPKGVVVTHGNLDTNLRMMSEEHHAGGETFVSWVPHFHDMGLIGNFYMSVHLKIPLHLMPAEAFVRRPLSWLRLMARVQGTHTTAPHSALGLCTRLAHTLRPGEIDLSSTRLIVDSSEPIDWKGVEEFEAAFAPFGLPRGTVVPHYGLAECTVMVSYPTDDRPRYIDVDRESLTKGEITLCSDPDQAQRIANCGRGQIDCEFAIVEPQTSQRLPADRVGEVWITGSHVAQGYWQRPEESAQAFGQEIAGEASGKRYVRSGDFGFVHDGDLYITGRMKDVIIVRGRNFHARDIELLAETASPLVREGRVVAIPLTHKGQETFGLLAEVAGSFDYRLHAFDFVSAFTSALRDQFGLSPYRIALVRRNSLPRTTSGKIRRPSAAQLYHAGGLNSLFEYEMPRFTSSSGDASAFPGIGDRDALRAWLEVRVLEHAGVASIKEDEDLFALGVDSLSMTNVLLEIEDASGRSLLQEEFYAVPTLRTLVGLLSDGVGQQGGPPEPSSPSTSKSTPTKDQKEKSLKERLVWRLRDHGPIAGSWEMPYEMGSRLLDRVAGTKAFYHRAMRPLSKALDALLEENDYADPDAIRREVSRAYTWVIWRERVLGDPELFAKYVTILGLERIARAREGGYGIVLGVVTSRLQGLYKYVPELTEKPFGVIGNQTAERMEFYGMGAVARSTGARGIEYVPSARVAQIHNAHRILRQGGTVGVFMDNIEGVGGITVPFFGRRRPVRPGLAELALDTRSVIIPADQRLHDEGRITIEFHAPFVAKGRTREEQLLSLMLQQAEALERVWRTAPGQLNAEALRRQQSLPRV
ncbi:MAG: AMP-binding protein [Erythrobacter sp.]|uniref:LpxL/LpxP family acyltransferase n=1 Tax=Erythrobacter sp. TaxID=1042 RepID=UPI00261A9A21|nr:AMP-binding protein [Erythrobacter sp.]MDJ0978929.1 AMP-binding protein [Erythrobacter sp.]